ARHIDRLQKLALPGVTCRSVDLNQPQDLPALLTGIDTLYYLVNEQVFQRDRGSTRTYPARRG
ncbi:hypothetical protein C6H70_30380, partial [Klebsiella pneumoniae]